VGEDPEPAAPLALPPEPLRFEPPDPVVEPVPVPFVIRAFDRLNPLIVLLLVPEPLAVALRSAELESALCTHPTTVTVEPLCSPCDVRFVGDVEPLVVFCAATPALAQNAAIVSNDVALMCASRYQ